MPVPGSSLTQAETMAEEKKEYRSSEPEIRNEQGTVLEVEHLTVRFKTENGFVDAVIDESFCIRQGETLALVGKSGSGKSVTSLAVMRLVEHGGGKIICGSIRLTRRDGTTVDLAADEATLRKIRGDEVAMIFQEPMTSLNPVFPVGEQIAESLRLHGDFDRAQAVAEAVRLLKLVRIPDAEKVSLRYPHQLSGGMRQRVMIAMALACKPRLLIADEPTTALDVTVQAQILALISELQEKMGMAVLFITHDMGVVAHEEEPELLASGSVQARRHPLEARGGKQHPRRHDPDGRSPVRISDARRAGEAA